MLNRSVILLSFVLLCCLPLQSVGQQAELKLVGTDHNLPDFLKYSKRFNSTQQRAQTVSRVRSELLEAGYLEASVDSMVSDSLLLTAYVHIGKQYKWAQLKAGNVDEEILSSIGFREKLYYNNELRPRQVANLYNGILDYCETNGYPFASIGMDSIEMNEDGLSAVLDLQKSHFITLDSVILKGNPKVAPIYIYNYLGLRPGMPYNETLIRNISTRLKEIPFVTEKKKSEVVFTPKHATVFLYLENKKASQFNGILGVLPDDETGEITITGDVKLRLKNSLGRGELIDLNWRKLQNLTQDLKIQFTYPFLFNTPFGVDANFKLYKRDTTFLELNRNLGIQYILKGGDFLKVFVHNQKSDLLSTQTLINSTSLPAFADVNTVIYGIGIQKQRLDYRLNPRKGYSLEVTGGVGTKRIKQNAELLEDNPSIYDDVNLRSTQYNVNGITALYLPIAKRSTVMFGVNGGYLLNDNMFLNEMSRIGGIRTLRGFDEESIIASSFSIFTLEYRFLLEQNSNVYAFFDGAWYENRTPQAFVTDTPYGFGAGISFETKAGIFSVNYALGKQFDNPILFRAAKIHFGFTSVF